MSDSQDLSFSEQGASLLKGIETLRLSPYDDQSGNEITEYCKGATIGYGHLILESEWDTYSGGITKEQADALFMQDAQPIVSGVNRLLTVVLAQNEFDTAIS